MLRPTKFFTQSVLTSVFLVAGCALSSAQTISDSNQNQTWGVWKTPNPATPGLQFHAKCDKDIDPDNGKISSWWSYQFRNTYKGTMDFIYLVEGGIADPKVNKMVGGFKYTLKPGEIYDGGSLLWGSCSQHSLPKTGIHMTLKCVVPTGQDSPCFNDAEGNPYPQAAASGSMTGPSVAGGKSGAVASKGKMLYGWCTGQGPHYEHVFSQLFESIAPSPDTDENRALLNKKLAYAFANFLFAAFPGSNTRPSTWTADIPIELVWNPYCESVETKDGAMGYYVQIKGGGKAQDWPPASPTGTEGVRRVN